MTNTPKFGIVDIIQENSGHAVEKSGAKFASGVPKHSGVYAAGYLGVANSWANNGGRGKTGYRRHQFEFGNALHERYIPHTPNQEIQSGSRMIFPGMEFSPGMEVPNSHPVFSFFEVDEIVIGSPRQGIFGFLPK